MIKLQLETTWAHKRRFVGTFLATFLGVAFLAGTLTLGDTLETNFDRLFTNAASGTDAVVRSSTSVDTDRGPVARGLIDASLLRRVRAVDGVAVAQPSVLGYGQLRGKDGDPIGSNGPPTFAGSWITDRRLNPYHLVRGRAPAAADEVVVNERSADDGNLHVGDVTTLQTPEPMRVRVVGIADFGNEPGMGGVTFAGLTLDSAQQNVIKAPGRVSSIVVRGEPGVGDSELAGRIRSTLPDGVEVITGRDLAAENTANVNDNFLDLLRTILVVFAAIALLVATFSIYNAFSIIATQRTRESALLRAVGATRGQLLAAVTAEALVVGLVASVAGLFGGLGLATLLKLLFGVVGLPLPTGGLVVTTETVIVAVGVGLLVTLLAAIAPAIRASRVAPLAAIRDVAVERIGALRLRAALGVVLLGVGVAGAAAGALLVSGDAVLLATAAGAILTLAGFVVCGPVVAQAATRTIASPLPRLRGVTGRLARLNAMRNPRRTAATSSALMVGVAVVAVFTVFAASLKASVDETVSGSLTADLVVSGGGFGNGALSPDLARQIDELPSVRSAVGLGGGSVLVDGESTDVTVADPRTIPDVLDPEVVRGSFRALGPGEIAVSDTTSDDHHWRMGDSVPVTFTDGTTSDLTIGAIYGAEDFLSGYLIGRADWTPHAVQSTDSDVLVDLRSGASESAAIAAIERVADPFGAPDVETRAEYVDTVAGRIDTMLTLVYVMLALAVLIALMGIANTLSLSVYERTREIGLLRAVGETRGQVRSMVRWESVIIAVFGTIGGLALGLFLGWAFFEAASNDELGTFAAPVGQLVVILIVGGIAGVLAGIRPARRASRLAVLSAIAAA